MSLDYHVPVLLNQSIEALNIQPNGVYIDVTFGGGGHSKAILNSLGNNGKLYSLDVDRDANVNVIEDKRFTFIQSNFRYLTNFMLYLGISNVDGILADLGVSSHQFDEPSRGFSHRFNAKLDMRMNVNMTHTAEDILNSYSEEQLSELFYSNADMYQANNIARAIVEKRTSKNIVTTSDLYNAISHLLPTKFETKLLARLFQALRIEVNEELNSLSELLLQSSKLIKDKGRLSIITYHSIEDRLVKNMFKYGNPKGKITGSIIEDCIPPFRTVGKFICPSNEEIAKNPRARSAKLRIAEKTKR
jgi:16S rRNA (cytosine1402-N4)-methyltransferase